MLGTIKRTMTIGAPTTRGGPLLKAPPDLRDKAKATPPKSVTWKLQTALIFSLALSVCL